jgi:lysophospholipase L1-like esterase
MRLSLTAVASLVAVSFASAQQPDSFAKWEKEIAGIEKRLTDAPPKKGGTLFAGSSSIRLWKLQEPVPGAINVGFGGSVIRDSTHFAGRIILPHEPARIFFYAGDNDVAAKHTPEQVRDDFQAFVKLIRAKLPKTRILYLAIKPSLKRWEQYETQKSANAMVKEVCEKDERLTYLDTVTIMLGKDGKPMPELFVKDGLHMSEKGYALWNDLVKKHLK